MGILLSNNENKVGIGLSFNLEKEIVKWKKITKVKNPSMLNLGAGQDRKKGWVNQDQVKNDNIQIVHDLNKYPYPIKDKSFDIIFMSHVLEHLDDPIKTLNELHRILKNNGLLIIRVPHYAGNSSWIDLTHRRPYSLLTLNSISDKDHCKLYGIKVFGSVHARLGFWKFWYYPWNYLIEPLSRIQPVYFECVLGNIFPPFEVIYLIQK